MPLIQLVLQLDSSASLNVETIFKDLRTVFPALRLQCSDALADRAHTAREIVERLQLPQDKAELICRTLENNASLYGPAFSVSLTSNSGTISGTLRPVDLAFWTDGQYSEEDWCRIVEFVKSLHCGRISVFEDED